MSLDTDICLYNLTLRHNDASIRSCVGNFSGKKSQEIATATSNRLIISKPDPSTGKLVPLSSSQLFGIVRSLANFKISNTGKDYIALTSDSGNLSIIEYDPHTNNFISLFNEPYHKSGIRRLAPGNDIITDPKGRAIILSSIERNRLVYVVNRDLDNHLTVASPLEANTSKLLTIHTVALDVGFENPQFAAIEIDYSQYEHENEHLQSNFQRTLTYYELDLGLNHVVKKLSDEVPSTSNFLLQVPGGNDGPSGVVVCSQNALSYRNLQGDNLSIGIPRFEGQSEDSYIVAGVTHTLKDRSFFFIVQTNHGDLFKLELPPNRTLVIGYFDTIPLSTSLVITKSGFLFADTEYGDKYYYQFESLGRDENRLISKTSIPTNDLSFERTELVNISPVDVIESINPLFDSILVTDDLSTKIYGLSGTNESSSLKLLQYGLPITEVVESELPSQPHRVWTTKTSKQDTLDQYLIISFMDTTNILSIGENVEEVTDSGFITNESTLGVQQVGQKSVIQIHNNGIRLIQEKQLIKEWQPPAGIKIISCTSTNTQLAIVLSNHELVYFEIDQEDRLIEWNERKEISSNVTSMSLGEIPEGLLRSPFLIIGDQEKIMRVFSTDPKSTLELVSMQQLDGVPTSILQCFMNGSLAVNVGMDNGVYLRTLLDASGELYESRVKYLGNKPVILSKTVHKGENVVLAFSNQTWAISEFKHFKINQILLPPLRFAHSFNSEDCPFGVVGVYKNTLVIFTIDDFDHEINSNSLELQSSPRQIIKENQYLFIMMQGHIGKFNTETSEFEAELALESNTKILTSTIVMFESKSESYLIVSIGIDYDILTGSFTESFIYTYTLDLQLVHKTKLTDLAFAMVTFQGKLLVGVKDHLRLFDIGSKQLLNKAITQVDAVSNIIKIEAQGSRVVIADIRESVTMLTYNSKMNEFITFVDDVVSRHMTELAMVDYSTVVGGDKFGNLFLLRCSDEVSKAGENSSLVLTRDRVLNGAPYKLDNVCNFFLEDIPTSFNKGSFTKGGKDVISYTGLQGTIGVLIPLLTRSDINFFKKLEKAMRLYVPSLTGRMHLQYRGYYQPVKNVVDGDLIETFNDLSSELKENISEEVGKDAAYISAKIYEVRALSI